MASASKALWRRCTCTRLVGAFAGLRLLATKALQGPEVEKRKQWQVSSHGRVCNTKGRVSNGHLQGSGYYRVNVLGNDFYVHRLVAFAFLGPPPADDTWQVHHRDGTPSNNRVENLEYVTQSQNMKESFAKPRGNGGPCCSLPVMWRAVGSQIWTTSPSITDAAKQLGMDRSTVSKASSQGKPAKGYDFQFSERCEIATLDGEEWRQMLDPKSGSEVPGRMVSSLGRIRSQTGIISRGYLRKQGYYQTMLSLGFFKRSELVHRLVAFAFLGQPVDHRRHHVNHKDLDKGNNAVENLEYVTPSENMVHHYACRDAHPRSYGKAVESRCYGSSDEWRCHMCIKSAADTLGLFRSNIYHCLADRYRHTGGFEFRLANSSENKQLAGEEWRNVNAELIETLLQEQARRQIWCDRVSVAVPSGKGGSWSWQALFQVSVNP